MMGSDLKQAAPNAMAAFLSPVRRLIWKNSVE
jgi:hypothetical protein